MLEIEIKQKKDIVILALNGHLDSVNKDDFRAIIRDKTTEGFRAFAINAHDLQFISSGGISVLIEVHQFINYEGGKIVCFHVNYEVEKLIQFLKIDCYIPIYPTFHSVETALDSYYRIPKTPQEELKKSVTKQNDMSNIDILDSTQETKISSIHKEHPIDHEEVLNKQFDSLTTLIEKDPLKVFDKNYTPKQKHIEILKDNTELFKN